MKKFLASMVLVISLVAFTFPAFASTFTPRVIKSTAEPAESGSKFGEGKCV